MTAAAPHRTASLLAAAALGTLLIARAAPAHKLDATVTFPPDRLRVAVAYDDGDPAAGAACTLLDAAGRELVRDRTGDDGICTFARPPAGRYALVADDGDGHRARLNFEVTANPGGHRGATTVRNRGAGLAGGLALLALAAVASRRLRRGARTVGADPRRGGSCESPAPPESGNSVAIKPPVS